MLKFHRERSGNNDTKPTIRTRKRKSSCKMLNSKAVLRQALHITVPVCVFIGLYIPTLIAAILSGKNDYYSPVRLVVTFFTSSSARKLGAISATVLVIAVVSIVVRNWKQKLYEDKLGRKREFSLDYQPYGNAHWAEPCEYSNVAQIRPIEKCKGTILGQLTDDGTQCIDMYDPKRINKHVAAIGSSGSGKSFALVMPYIIQAVKQRHSVIITDPKGELYQEMAGYLEDNGYIVRRFDLITLIKSDGWDCMKFLRGLKGDELETNAQIFATIVVTNIEKDTSVYSRGAIALLKALVLYTVLRKDIPDSEKTIAKVNEMLQQEGVAYFESVFGKTCPSYLKPAQSSYRTFAQASPNLHGNIVSHLATGMQILQTGLIEKIMSTDDIDLNLPGDIPCAYFCRFSATNNTFRFVSAMFFSMLFISLIDHADRMETKKLKVPVDFVMDEFPSLGVIPSWLEKISNIRSYGITAIMIMQGMSQLRGNYGDDATMILGNCGTILNIGMNDEDTAEWFQERMGVASIKVFTESEDTSISRKRSSLKESKGVGKDYLMSVSDLYNMDVDDTIIIFQHCHPIYAHKVPITAFPEYKLCRKITDDEIPDFDNAVERAQKRERERIRVAKYNREHTYIAPVVDEEYEEPVDFSTLGTLGILRLIFKEDIRSLKNMKKRSKEKSVLAKVSLEEENTSRSPISIYIDDDIENEMNMDVLSDAASGQRKINDNEPATEKNEQDIAVAAESETPTAIKTERSQYEQEEQPEQTISQVKKQDTVENEETVEENEKIEAYRKMKERQQTRRRATMGNVIQTSAQSSKRSAPPGKKDVANDTER